MAANLLYNWNHPKGLLFGKRTGSSAKSYLCKEFLKGPTDSADVTCKNPGEMMIGFNPLTNTMVCRSVSPKISAVSPCAPG